VLCLSKVPDLPEWPRTCPQDMSPETAPRTPLTSGAVGAPRTMEFVGLYCAAVAAPLARRALAARA
jgi:hypothetical protein